MARSPRGGRPSCCLKASTSASVGSVRGVDGGGVSMTVFLIGSLVGGVGLVDPVPDVGVPGAVGRPLGRTRLLRRVRVDHDVAGLARKYIVQPLPDPLLRVRVVLPARLEVAQLLDPLAGLLLLPLQVGDVGTLGHVLPYRVREGDDEGAE